MFDMKVIATRGGVQLRAVNGHFATNHSHINYFIDTITQKARLAEAKAVAKELAYKFYGDKIDTILCLDGMTLVGAYLADNLSASGRDIAVVEPEYNSSAQMTFRDNVHQPYIREKNVLILMASITTGFTAKRGIQGTKYYGGKVVGVAGLYRAVEQLEYKDVKVASVFEPGDLPDYESYEYSECPFCQDGRRLDALVNSHGYTRL